MVSRSRTQGRKWARWIGSGALVLTLVGLTAPATTSARVMEQAEEVIVIEDDAPLTSPWWYGGYTGSSGAPSGPSSGAGGSGGSGGSGPSGGNTTSSPAQQRLTAAKQDCQVLGGAWNPAVFNDYVTRIAYAGYSCRVKYPNLPFPKGPYEWRYYDSEGYLNQICVGDLDVQTCTAP